MSIVRLVVAWLVMAALPLQGFAAASMLFCDQATHSAASADRGHDHASHQHAAAALHDQASHDHGPHGHDLDASAHGAKVSQQHAGDGKSATAGADARACPICASCCNLVALWQTPILSLEAGRPAPPALEGPARVLTRHAPAPDKPPRA